MVGTTISISWTPPSSTPYGYRIYYQAEGDQGPPQSVVVTSGSTTSHDLTVPQSGVSYTISIQTLSSTELPSAVTAGVSTAGKVTTHQRSFTFKPIFGMFICFVKTAYLQVVKSDHVSCVAAQFHGSCVGSQVVSTYLFFYTVSATLVPTWQVTYGGH